MVAVGKDGPAAGHHLVERPRHPHPEPLHPAGEPDPLLRLDEQVDVVSHDRVVHEPKVALEASSVHRFLQHAKAAPRAQVPELLARSDILVNNMEAGAPDKVVYEAAAACLPVLASNPVFDELFDGYPLLFERDSPESLAERLRWFAALDEGERAEIGRTLRKRVAQRHSVGTWADGVLAAAR